MTPQEPEPQVVTFVAQESQNLDTLCYRGTAPLCDLTLISQADVFDQVTNEDGLQRDLNKRHAAEAYDYVARERDDAFPRAFPEVVLNARDIGVLEMQPIKGVPGDLRLVQITVDLNKLARAKSVKISRVDGNHRLYYANGDGQDRAQITAQAPFQLHIGLSREQEAALFLDINAEQKGLNTSHLAVLRSRLTADEVELRVRPWRAFANRLAVDPTSPFHNQVFMGGSKAGLREVGSKPPVTFVALEQAVRRILSKSVYIQEIQESEARYGLIRSYWQAVATTWPEGFEKPAEYLITKSIGVNSLALLGAAVIDRSLARGNVTPQDMVLMLKPTRQVYDWSKDADPRAGVGGMSGNRAVLLIAGELGKKLPTLGK